VPAIVESILNLPLFVVILGAGTVLSAVITAPIAKRWREPWPVVFGLGVSLSLVAAATLSPSPGSASGPCLQDIVRPLGPRGLLLFSTDRALNTWLLVPLGLCAGYLAVRRWWILLLAFMVPVAVEGTQRVVPELGRRCQFQDLIDNTWGLILGAVVGVSLGFVVPWIGRTLRR
jgi:hypothetical protein